MAVSHSGLLPTICRHGLILLKIVGRLLASKCAAGRRGLTAIMPITRNLAIAANTAMMLPFVTGGLRWPTFRRQQRQSISAGVFAGIELMRPAS
jgi:hypothetical protein